MLQMELMWFRRFISVKKKEWLQKSTIFFVFIADLFDILLPMLNIYQEFVRNHQYSLQVLANCKQNRDFDKLLKQYESNTACEGRMLETFLTYPMFQVILLLASFLLSSSWFLLSNNLSQMMLLERVAKLKKIAIE